MFSKACEYGIKAVIYIASRTIEGNRVKIADVAKYSGSPEAFTAKILGTLSRSGIVRSLKGPNGGFEIEDDKMQQIKVGDIVCAIDGDSIYNGCALGLEECNPDAPCPMHDDFIEVRKKLKNMLQTTLIYELAIKFRSGESFLKRS